MTSQHKTKRLASEVTAFAVDRVMSEISNRFAKSHASTMQVEQAFKDLLKSQYPIYTGGGRVQFNSTKYTGTPTEFEHE